MISPHTKPGTDVIAVARCPALFGLPGLTIGRLYTVERIVTADDDGDGPFAVIIAGHGVGRGAPRRSWRNFWRKPLTHRWAYRLGHFRYVELGGLEVLLDTRVKATP